MQTLLWFQVKDIRLTDIFYKILKFLRTSAPSLIALKDLLLLIIYVETVPLSKQAETFTDCFPNPNVSNIFFFYTTKGGKNCDIKIMLI